MKKETSIAIVLGLVLGGIVAFFMIFKTQEQKIETTKTISNQSKTVASSSANNNLSFDALEIKEPENNIILNKDTVDITGRVSKKSLIVIQSPIKEMTFENDKEDFKINFPLVSGENVIKITVYNKNIQAGYQERELKIYNLDEQ